jgi:hypothetical protein
MKLSVRINLAVFLPYILLAVATSLAEISFVWSVALCVIVYIAERTGFHQGQAKGYEEGLGKRFE